MSTHRINIDVRNTHGASTPTITTPPARIAQFAPLFSGHVMPPKGIIIPALAPIVVITIKNPTLQPLGIIKIHKSILTACSVPPFASLHISPLKMLQSLLVIHSTNSLSRRHYVSLILQQSPNKQPLGLSQTARSSPTTRRYHSLWQYPVPQTRQRRHIGN